MKIDKLKKKVTRILEELKDCDEVDIGYDFDGEGSGWIEIDNVIFEFNKDKEIGKVNVSL